MIHSLLNDLVPYILSIQSLAIVELIVGGKLTENGKLTKIGNGAFPVCLVNQQN